MKQLRTLLGAAALGLAALVSGASAHGQEAERAPTTHAYRLGTWTRGTITLDYTDAKNHVTTTAPAQRVVAPGTVIARMGGNGAGTFVYRGGVETANGLAAQFAISCAGYHTSTIESIVVKQNSISPLSLSCPFLYAPAQALMLSVGPIDPLGTVALTARIDGE